MPIGLLFWVIYIIAVLFGLWANYAPGQPFAIRPFGGYLVLWILVGILGYEVFGAAVRR